MNPSQTKLVIALRHAQRSQIARGLSNTGRDQASKLGQKIFQQIKGCKSCIVIVSGLDHGNETGRLIIETFSKDFRRSARITTDPKFSFDSRDDGESQAISIATLGHNYEVCVVVGHGSAPVGIARKYAEDMGLPRIEDTEPVFGSGYKIDIEKRTIELFYLETDLESAK